MIKHTDQIGREVELAELPRRVISLVPSQTELLYELGLEEEVVGITKFCVHPGHWFRQKQRVGGTKNLNRQKINDLKPDLIIANKEENTREEIESLMKDYPVWVSDVRTLADAIEMIRGIGEITGKDAAAGALCREIEVGFEALQVHKKRTAAYFIWNSPMMSVSQDTFIHEMLEKAGFQNVYANSHDRYPETDFEELLELNPELILLSSEPYPFNEKHLSQYQSILPNSKVRIVDGELFSWYGSRLRRAASYFLELLND